MRGTLRPESRGGAAGDLATEKKKRDAETEAGQDILPGKIGIEEGPSRIVRVV